MKRDRSGQVIAIVALVVGVIGLSLGFAAYSSYFTINTQANVVSDQNWDVGFSTNGSTIENVTTAGTKAGVNANANLAGGSVNVTKYTISQGTNAVLETKAGSYVTYTVNILNKGTLTAYLDTVDFSANTIACEYITTTGGGTGTWIEGVNGAGTLKTDGTGTISNADCAKMFDVTLSIGGVEYNSSSATFANTLAANGSVEATLKLAYKGTTEADNVAKTLDGDILVTAGDVSVVYTSTQPTP